MKTLLVLRHAKSSWKDPALADHDRPLNKRGRAAAPAMGRFLDEQGLRPDRILCSTARRARQTAKCVAEGGAFDCPIDFVESIYGAEADQLAAVLREVPGEAACAMLIGHNPELEELVEGLAGAWATLPTAAVARIELDVDTWADVALTRRGTLVDTWRPRDLA